MDTNAQVLVPIQYYSGILSQSLIICKNKDEQTLLLDYYGLEVDRCARKNWVNAKAL